MNRVRAASRWGLALALVMSVWAMSGTRAEARSALPGHHIYCIRGFLNVFSFGMDELCDKLSRAGYTVSTHNHAVWSSLASEMADGYKSGRARTIIVIGHSYGGDAVASITQQLGSIGVPVKLAVEIDCLWGTTANGRVDRFINLYNSNSGKPVVRGASFKGSLQNLDLTSMKLSHVQMDKDPAIHARVMGYVRQAMARPAPQQAPATSSPVTSSDVPTRSAAVRPAN